MTGTLFGFWCAFIFVAVLVLAHVAALAIERLVPRYGPFDERLWRWAYDRYMDSERWERLSDQVKRRDNFTCRDCGHVAERKAKYPGGIKWREPMHAHHKPGTYKGWLWYALCLPERKRNLVTLCESCHRRIHGD